MFVVVFINCTADFQKLLHNVSSLVGSNESLAFEIPVITYCLYIFVLANRAKVEKSKLDLTGAPNEHFSENEPLTTENENLDAFKAFSSAFLCCWKEVICSSIPAG